MPSYPDRRRLPTIAIMALLALVVAGLAVEQYRTINRPNNVVPSVQPTPQLASGYQAPAAGRRQAQADQQRTERAVRASEDRTGPFLIGIRSNPMLVLTRRAKTYRLRKVAQRWPDTVSVRGRVVTLRHSILLAPGAELTVGRWIRQLRLRSDGPRSANVIGVRSRMLFHGRTGSPLVIRSHLPGVGADSDASRRRPYLQMSGGSLRMDHVVTHHLGFATGATSGVAWLHWLGKPSRGGARDTTFRQNLFGAYTSGVRGLRLHDVRFLHNEVYGFDPHGRRPGDPRPGGGTIETLVTRALAAHNGSHGIIFSSGCHRNTVRDTISRDNAGSGFVLDDGLTRKGQVRPSNANRLVRITALRNAGAGVVVEGGRANEVAGVTVRDSRFGIAIREAASETSVTGADIAQIQDIAVRISNSSHTTVRRTQVNQTRVGVVNDRSPGTTLADVTVTDAWQTGLVIPVGQDVTMSGVAVSGVGMAAVKGSVTSVDVSGYQDRPQPTSLNERLSDTRHLVWILILLAPLAALSLARVLAYRRRRP